MAKDEKVYILAVDDKKDNLLALNALFADMNVDLISALSGKEALKHLMGDKEFAVILMDAVMPVMDGFETARAIRGRLKTQHIPIIFLTAMQKDSIHAELGYDIGAVDYIYKPIVPEILKTKVSVFVDLFKKNRELKNQSEQLVIYKSNLERSLSEIKEVNRELRKLASIVETSNDAIIAKDLNGIILSWNKAAETIFGYTADEMIGKSVVHLIPIGKQKEEAELLRKLRNGERIEHHETTRITRNGDTIDVSLTLSPMKDVFGEVIGISAIARDITEKKRLERQFKDSKDELEELNKSLLKAKNEAVQASMLKSDFVANMSHEIRTPLNGIIGMTNILLNTKLTREQYDYANTIQEASDSLLSVVNDVLDFSKIEAGYLEIEYASFDLINLVEGVCHLLSTQAKAKRLSLVTYIDPKIPRSLRGDSQRLKQVLVNLVSNAIKFSNEGEIFVKVTIDSVSDTEVEICFFVIDSGIGMSDEEIRRLFKPFVQAEGSISRKYGGTGLGLSICKRLVNLMNGEIGVSSVKNKGSNFWFSVPLELEKLSRDEPTISQRKKRRILVVDDEPYARKIMQKYLAAWGMESVLANSAREAMLMLKNAIAEDNSFDVAILDKSMNDMSGLELARKMLEVEELQDIKLILVSASDMKSVKKQAKKIGFSGFLAKPIIQSQLLNCINEVTREKDSENEFETVETIKTERSGERRLKTKHILIVDDYKINQQVVKIYLEDWNFTCHAVENGIEAIESVKENHYDLILMDCQMPEMDGFTATGEIRKLETLSERHIPIVAMTAYAMTEDREKCLEAGMDDYLSKPIEPVQLQEILEKWLPDTQELLKTVYTDSTFEDQEDSGLFVVEKLKSRVGEEGLRELVNSFLNNCEEYVKNIKTAVTRKDRRELARTAHGISGICSVVCAEDLRSLCAKLEGLAKEEDWKGAEELADEFERVMSKTHKVMAIVAGDQNET